MYQDSLIAIAFDMALREVTAENPLNATQRTFLRQLLDEAIAEEIRESSSSTTVRVKVPSPEPQPLAGASGSTAPLHNDTMVYRYSEGVWTFLIPNAEVEVRDRQSGLEETVKVSLLKCQIHEPVRKRPAAKRAPKRPRGA